MSASFKVYQITSAIPDAARGTMHAYINAILDGRREEALTAVADLTSRWDLASIANTLDQLKPYMDDTFKNTLQAAFALVESEAALAFPTVGPPPQMLAPAPVLTQAQPVPAAPTPAVHEAVVPTPTKTMGKSGAKKGKHADKQPPAHGSSSPSPATANTVGDGDDAAAASVREQWENRAHDDVLFGFLDSQYMNHTLGWSSDDVARFTWEFLRAKYPAFIKTRAPTVDAMLAYYAALVADEPRWKKVKIVSRLTPMQTDYLIRVLHFKPSSPFTPMGETPKRPRGAGAGAGSALRRKARRTANGGGGGTDGDTTDDEW